METNEALERFRAVLAEGLQLNCEEDLPMVESLLEAYPYFTLLAAMMLRSGGLDEATESRLKAAIALNASDQAALMKLIDPDGERFSRFYPDEPQQETPTTDAAIDTFLDQYGTMDPKEQNLLERLIFNPVPDYSQVLAREEPAADAPLSEQDALLDAFLARQEDAHQRAEHEKAEEALSPRQPSAAATKTDADAPLSESLAKIYIKQGRYDKAYEIIYQLSLNFPKKSVYFADQLRFLRKLIINQQSKK